MMLKKAISIHVILYTFLCLGILAEIIYLYKDIFAWMVAAWFNYPPDRFGPYVAVIFICIFLYRLTQKTKPVIESDFRGFSVTIIGLLLFLTGYIANIHIIQAVSFILTYFGILICLMGTGWARIMLFPFFFLILMLPTISFLLESTFGVPIRHLIADTSGVILDLTGGDWRISGGILYLNEIDLPINYMRHSVSSPLVFIILSFIVAEVEFSRNLYKFLFAILCWLPFVVIGHSTFFILMGWSFEHEFIKLSEAIWRSRDWLPVTLLLFMLLISALAIQAFKRNRTI